MATVVDLSGNASVALTAQGRSTDVPLEKINRSTATGPNSVLTPEYVGERVRNTADTPPSLWIAIGTTNADWQRYDLGQEVD